MPMHISCSAQRCGILPAGNSTSPETPCVSALKVPRQTAGRGRLSSVVWWVVCRKPKLTIQQPASMNGDACIMMHVCIMQPWHHASCIRACRLVPRELGSGVDLHGGGDVVLPAHDPARVRLARLLDVEALRCGLERRPIG